MQFVGAFGVWILADEIGLSAIVTVVTFAITAARITPERTPASLRLPSYAVWETVVFVLNVLAFVAIGLQLRPILGSLEADERTHYLQIAGLVLATVVFVRIAWVFLYNRLATFKCRLFGAGSWPGAYVPTLAGSTIVGWCGMRGIVTLATAFALPRGQWSSRIPISRAHPALRIRRGRRNARRPGAHTSPADRAARAQGRRRGGERDSQRQAQLARVAAEIIDADDSDAAQMLRAEFAMPGDPNSPKARRSEHAVRNRLRARIIAAQRRDSRAHAPYRGNRRRRLSSNRGTPRPRRGQRPLAAVGLRRPAVRNLLAKELVIPVVGDRQRSLFVREVLPDDVAPSALDHPRFDGAIALRLGAAKTLGKISVAKTAQRLRPACRKPKRPLDRT